MSKIHIIRTLKKLKPYKGAGIALFKKINGDYSILLGKRNINPDKGKWSIFGGKREKEDKSDWDTAKREFFEESYINFDTLKTKEIEECKFCLPFFKWTTFLREVDDSFSAPNYFSSEFSDLKFIALNEINKYKLAFGVRKEIKKFLKIVQYCPR